MTDNFHRDFISRIKRNVSNNPEIFSEKLDEDDSRNEKESIADEYNTDDSRSIQDRMMSILSSNDTAGIFTSFLDRLNNQQNLVSPSSGVDPQGPSSSTSGVDPQGPSSSGSSFGPQTTSSSGSSFGPQTTSSSGSSFGPQTPSSSSSNSSTVVPSSSNIQQPQVLPVGGMQISSVPSNAPLWIRNLHDKYVDILPPITVPLSNHDKVGRQMFFDEIIAWINTYLEDNGITLPDDIREIKDVIIP
ncbi:immunodominant virion protein [Pigeonpox virus]|uniref:Immunodominant virion protein n=1 Tax=Pigeonpox virus TaxID=10264 RepID=A0A068EGC6_9POXV|nr:immunodominant virion protein [Pigeonpox virus]AID46675.1 immunodominant virion protein [Pigeonpox virus]WCL40116.1 immunodominant virion protein [Pigeonpox virus]